MGTSVFILLLSCGLTAIFAGPPVNDNYEDNEVSRSTEADLADSCTPKDDDGCLQTSPGWDDTYKCESSTEYCSTYGKDMRRCCPETCNTGTFTEEACNGFDGSGTCVYPNDAQCATLALTCNPWPSSIVSEGGEIRDIYGCFSNNNNALSWTLLDEKQEGTAECELLCRAHASDDGCCYVKDGEGCWWKNAAVAGPGYGSGKAVRCTSNPDACVTNEGYECESECTTAGDVNAGGLSPWCYDVRGNGKWGYCVGSKCPTKPCTCKEYYPPELKTSGEDACSNGGGTCYGLQENGHKYASRNGPIDGPDDQPYRGCLFREKGMKDEADKCKYFPSFNSCPIYAPSICHTTAA